MLHLLIIVAMPLLLTVLTLPLARILGKRLGAWDHPDELGIHSAPTARSGGIAILLGITVSLELMKLLPGAEYDPRQAVAISIGTLAFFFVGLLDDLREIKPYVKSIGLVLAALLFVLLSPYFRITGFERLDIIIAVVALVGGANALNFIDGMDGLAAGMTVIAALGFVALGRLTGEPTAETWALILAAAGLAFWLANKPPASIFMGDCGSLVLGMSLTGVMLVLGSKGGTRLVSGAIVLSPLILDTALAIARRALLRRDIFSGDRRHIYDLIYARTGSVWRTDALMYLMGLAFALLGVGSLYVPVWAAGSAVFAAYAVLTWQAARLGMFAPLADKPAAS